MEKREKRKTKEPKTGRKRVKEKERFKEKIQNIGGRKKMDDKRAIEKRKKRKEEEEEKENEEEA